MRVASVVLLLATFLPLGASAQELAKTSGGWTGTGELGLAMARGNTRPESLNTRLRFAREEQRWKNAFSLSALRSRAAGGGAAPPRAGGRRRLGRARARTTPALFASFLRPPAVSGWAPYSALAGEPARAPRAVAQRAAAVAVLEFRDVDGNLHELAEHAGSDVLYYFRGELADVSSPEALALGVYGAWMPPAVYLSLEGGDELAAVETRTIGDRPFLTAFHSLPATGTLAVPMALAAGDTAVRQRELAHLVL